MSLEMRRRGVDSHIRRREQRRSGPTVRRMHPIGGDVGQWSHHEPAVRRAGVRQDQAVVRAHDATEGDQIEIQGSGAVGDAAAAAEGVFDFEQGRHKRAGRMRRLDKGDAVEIVRVRCTGPRRRTPPRRAGDDVDPRARQTRHRRRQ